MKYQKLYNELYKNGYHGDFELCHARHLFGYINKYLEKNTRILDIGCSHGTAVGELKKQGYDSYGIDISSVAIDLCNQRNIKNCKVGSAIKLEFVDSYFDGIVSSDVFEHLDPSEVESAILECNRVLKVGGVGIISIATVEEGNRTYDFVAKNHGLTNLHTSIFNSTEWTKKIKSVFPNLTVTGESPALFIFKK